MTNIPTRIIPGFATSSRTLAVRMLGSRTGRMLSIRPFEDLVGIGVQTDIRVLADVHGIEIIFVNVADDPDIRKIGDGEGIGADNPCTPAAFVTCWSVITPDMGAMMSTIPDGWSLSTPRSRNCSVAASRSALASCSVSSACSSALLAIAPLS